MSAGKYARMMRRRGVDPCAYVPGLYTEAEVDDLINIDGYIPVADAAEFQKIPLASSQTMGGCSIWAGNYTCGLDKKYIQIFDLDFTGITGLGYAVSASFIYDGNNKKLSNYVPTPSATISVHIFSASTTYTARNMRIYDFVIDKLTGTNCGLLGNAIGIYDNIEIYNSTFTTTSICAALIGSSSGSTISDILISGCTVNGSSTFGVFNGTVSSISNISIVNSDITGTGVASGIGSGSYIIDGATITGGSITGTTVSGINNSANSATITNCTLSSVDLNGTNVSGIFNGNASVSTGNQVLNCVLIATSACAGIGIGDVSVSNCTFSGGSITGGLIGVQGILQGFGAFIVEDCVVENCTINSATTITGGITQARGGMIIRRCRVENVDINVSGTRDRIGGISGLYFNGGTIEECEVINCNIDATNSTGVGGIVGYDQNNNANILINCRVVGGTIHGLSDVGGIMGRSLQALSNSSNSFSTAAITGTSNVGGAYGRRSGGTVSNVYWDTVASGNATSAAGTGQTTSDLQTPTSNTGIYSAWTIPPWDFGTSTDYPVLTTTP